MAFETCWKDICDNHWSEDECKRCMVCFVKCSEIIQVIADDYDKPSWELVIPKSNKEILLKIQKKAPNANEWEVSHIIKQIRDIINDQIKNRKNE